jgi:hypothetical protein
MSNLSVQDTGNPQTIDRCNFDAPTENFGKKLLREYSEIPDEDVDGHVKSIVGSTQIFRLKLTKQSSKASKVVIIHLDRVSADIYSGHTRALQCTDFWI